MAGHNKWSQIKHKKAKEDSKRGKAFTKLIKEITVAAREGGGNPDGNARLRLLLEKGKEINMPLENAVRAVKRGTGELPGVNYEEYTYEGYGPYGIAVIVETLSDNKNRTVAELRRLFSENGGTLAETGAVNWMFEKLGVINANGTISEDKLLEYLLEVDVKDISIDNTLISIYCDPKSLEAIKNIIEKAGLKIESSGLEWVATATTDLDKDSMEKTVEFLTAIQDHDDVKNVFTTFG